MNEEGASSPKKKSRSKTKLTPEYCEIEGCTWEHKIQRHRIVPGRDGGRYQTLNCVALCPNHHYLADNGLLTDEELHEIVKERYENGWLPVDDTGKDKQDAPEGAE